ncbi:MAG: polysaccharide deacetylase family protein [Deltaproteobacteria bacterium]|nr:polysaccharide deacetylase family protein [Deltaproteobacteria bacterium]
MNWRQMITCGISEISAIARRYSKPRKGLRILLYHAIGTQTNDAHENLFCLSSRLFEKHMTELSCRDTSVTIPLNDVISMRKMEGVVITFDDGYRDNLSVAAPILDKYKIPFTVFATTSYIRGGSFPFLNETELRALSANSLVSIGSHGVTHRPLTECDDRELQNELESSKHYLEDLTGKEITMISYPHGCSNKRVRDAAENAGFRLGASSYCDINNSSSDLLMLFRTCILSEDSIRIFRQKLHGDWDWYRWRQYLSMQRCS